MENEETLGLEDFSDKLIAIEGRMNAVNSTIAKIEKNLPFLQKIMEFFQKKFEKGIPDLPMLDVNSDGMISKSEKMIHEFYNNAMKSNQKNYIIAKIADIFFTLVLLLLSALLFRYQ